MDDPLVRQGLEQQLNSLEELRLDSIGDADGLEVCATCYIEKDQCHCDAPLYWSIEPVIYKLRADLRLVD